MSINTMNTMSNQEFQLPAFFSRRYRCHRSQTSRHTLKRQKNFQTENIFENNPLHQKKQFSI